jgi:hypothetical protein
MRITWNKALTLPTRDRAAIESALMRRATPGTAFVDSTGSFLICSLDEAPDAETWTPCATSDAGSMEHGQQSLDLRDALDDLRLALKDRNEAIDRLVAQRDAAIAERDAAQRTIAAYLEATTPADDATPAE